MYYTKNILKYKCQPLCAKSSPGHMGSACSGTMWASSLSKFAGLFVGNGLKVNCCAAAREAGPGHGRSVIAGGNSMVGTACTRTPRRGVPTALVGSAYLFVGTPVPGVRNCRRQFSPYQGTDRHATELLAMTRQGCGDGYKISAPRFSRRAKLILFRMFRHDSRQFCASSWVSTF